MSGEEGRADRPEHYVLMLDPHEGEPRVYVERFASLRPAASKYDELENEFAGKPQSIVLVKADDLNALKRAYPGYFLDTFEFLQVLHKARADAGKVRTKRRTRKK